MRLAVVLVAAGTLYAQRPEHPRPDFERPQWITLNGQWDFGFNDKFGRTITVPFCWESELSGIANKTGETTGWYRRTFTIPAAWSGKHAWLHFEAVDEEAQVWVNGKELGIHHGGYSPFEFDLNNVAKPGDTATVIVRAHDSTDQELPVGMQTPILNVTADAPPPNEPDYHLLLSGTGTKATDIELKMGRWRSSIAIENP